jgi:DNA-binding transcriptional LysR family regulator
VASGWETELAVAMDSMFSPACSTTTCRRSTGGQQTRLRIVQEALSGTWEALLDRRADLLVGAAGDGPAGGGYVSEPIGKINFVFAVAPSHPLADVQDKLGRTHLQHHRAISVADSARQMAPRTVGLLLGQDTLTVPDMKTKYQYQLAGMGFGFLPEPCARRHCGRFAGGKAGGRAQAGRDLLPRLAQRRKRRRAQLVAGPDAAAGAVRAFDQPPSIIILTNANSFGVP